MNLDGKDPYTKLIVVMMLIERQGTSFLPELYDAVGYDKMVSLLNLFSGVVVKFPDEKNIGTYKMRVDIYDKLSKADSVSRMHIVKLLSSKYGFSCDYINAEFIKIKKDLELSGLGSVLKKF